MFFKQVIYLAYNHLVSFGLIFSDIIQTVWNTKLLNSPCCAAHTLSILHKYWCLFTHFLGKCDLNNTVVSASFEKPSYNPVFAIITYTFRTVFVLLGQACLMRTSISLPLMFKDHVHTHVTIHILSLFYLQFAHYLVAMKSMETVVFSCSTRQTLTFPPVLFCLLYYVSATLSSNVFSAKIPYRLQNSLHQCFIFQLCCTVFCKRIF